MGKLNFNKKKVAVFLSGKGSNFKSLYKFSRKKNSRYKIILVISNKKENKGWSLNNSSEKSRRLLIIWSNNQGFVSSLYLPK